MTGFAKARQVLRGWIYPPVCGSCEVSLDAGRQLDTPFLCEECESRLTPIADDYCRICGQSYETGMSSSFACANCGDRELAFDYAVSAYRSSGMARELMHSLKYGRQLHLSRLMGVLMQRVWRDERLREIDRWLVVPVPLHPKRMRERTFNQSREIAVEFIRRTRSRNGLDSSVAELTLFPVLRRIRHTVRQAQLDRKERLRNPAGAFAMKADAEKQFARLSSREGASEQVGILVVDDVMTTGTTVSECVSVLRRSLDAAAFAGVSVMRG